jgi:hypothetical protein
MIVGILGGIWLNPQSYDSNYFSVEKSIYEDYGQQMKNDDLYTSVKNTDIQQEPTIGNSLTWTKLVWDIFATGLNPFSFTPNDFNTPIEKIGAWMLMLFRSLMYILIIIEIIMLLKNKKQS